MMDCDVEGIPCLWMRGGTSKGAYFLAADLPADRPTRDALLLAVMGSPDPRQIDGIGGGDPLSSKVAILSPPTRGDADVDYLFLQVFVDQPLVSDAQPCGNILAGVGPAAIELGLVAGQIGATDLRIHMRNTGEIAVVRVQTPAGSASYRGSATIDGVPGQHAPVMLMFQNIAGSMTGGQMLPTGRAQDLIEGIGCCLIDNGMPCVVMNAADFGLTGRERPETLEAMVELKARIEAIRLQSGPMMGLGDVSKASVPKMVLLSAPQQGGTIHSRCFIPHHVHNAVGVLAAVTIATACLLPQSPVANLAVLPADGRFFIEHPTGAAEIFLEIDDQGHILGAGTQRTARKLFSGRVFPAQIPSSAPTE